MKLFLFLTFFFNLSFLFAQIDSISIKSIEKTNDLEIISLKEKNPIKAALYSSILPGLGQAYNKKYWKIPIIWGLIGIGTGVMIYNNEKRNLYQESFIAELNNQPHDFLGKLNATSLAKRVDTFKRQLDYAIVLTSLVYLLNIFDANIDSHLSDFDKQFSLSPVLNENGVENIGLKLKLNL